MNNQFESKSAQFIINICLELASEGTATFLYPATCIINPKDIKGVKLGSLNEYQIEDLESLAEVEKKSPDYKKPSGFDFVFLEDVDGLHHLDGEENYKGIIYKYLQQIGEVEDVEAIVIKPVNQESVQKELERGLLEFQPLVMTEEVMMAAGQCANMKWLRALPKI